MVNAGRHMGGKRGGSMPAPVVVALCLALAACGNQPSYPESWWHQYEGGIIAKNRPPPPGAHDPFPNFAQLGTKPVTLPATTRQAQLAELTETRDLSLAAAAAAPLPVTVVAPAPRPQPTAAANSVSTLTSDAASAPPGATPAAPTLATQPGFTPTATQTVADIDHPPVVAPAPPAAAALGDVGGALGVVTAPAGDFDHLAVGFDPAADQVPREATPGLVAFAQSHVKKIIRVTGYGEGRDEAALRLAWRRAHAVAATLSAAGVPLGDLRLEGKAPGESGRGAELSLVD